MDCQVPHQGDGNSDEAVFVETEAIAEISITTDASPEGLGGYLVVNKKMIAAFASKVAQEDAETPDFELGSSASQVGSAGSGGSQDMGQKDTARIGRDPSSIGFCPCFGGGG